MRADGYQTLFRSVDTTNMSLLTSTLLERHLNVGDPANSFFLGHCVSINGKYRLQFAEILSKISV